jgi:SPX domain protein involved in polyphosphate accumulation
MLQFKIIAKIVKKHPNLSVKFWQIQSVYQFRITVVIFFLIIAKSIE